jgi:membrane protein required for colicin V production
MDNFMKEFMGNLNFTDLIAVLVILRLLYVGSSMGVGSQIMPLLWAFATFFSMIMFYPPISLFLQNSLGVRFATSIFVALLLIVILWIVLKIFLSKFSKGSQLSEIIKIEKYAGMFIGLLRGLLICGIILVLITTVPIVELNDKVSTSLFAGKILVLDTKAVYSVVKHVPSSKDLILDSDTSLNELFMEDDKAISIVKAFHLEPMKKKQT